LIFYLCRYSEPD